LTTSKNIVELPPLTKGGAVSNVRKLYCTSWQEAKGEPISSSCCMLLLYTLVIYFFVVLGVSPNNVV